MEKIVFLILSLYVLATEYRFMEHSEKSKNHFYKYLLNYHHDKSEDKSESILTLAAELAYLYTPESFPIINQVLSVFKKFELNLSKMIRENQVDTQEYYMLKRLKNGFNNQMIIPLMRKRMVKRKKIVIDENLETEEVRVEKVEETKLKT